ncbi:MAG: VTT domain-containing protein [Nanoarchaeota archaeon]|nr:VTT domain-containing protein [Nanoarchaeota archaeon]
MGFWENILLLEFSPIMYALLGGVWGDTFMIVVGFLYSQGKIPLLMPILSTLIGLIIADTIFYFIGRATYFERIKRTKRGKEIIDKTNLTIKFLTGNKLLVALFYSKFLFGVKFIINVYLGERKVPFGKYFTLNLLMAIFWTFVSWIIGYLSGKGFIWIWEYFDSLALASMFILVILAIIFNSSKKLKAHFNKKYS